MKKLKKMLVLLCAALLLTGCSGKAKQEKDEQTNPIEKAVMEEQTMNEQGEQTKEGETETAEQRNTEEQKGGEEETKETADMTTVETETAETKEQIIVIDPGHSGVVAQGSEPLGPGSGEYKAADASGTRGVSSGVAEYELTLTISKQLKEELENRGYTVLMTRESNDVPVSCVQRAEVANTAGAAAFVRIHANGSENQSVQGAMTICTTPQSPFVPELYELSRSLSDCMINKLCEATGCVSQGVWETDSMSGNNWSQVPATIVEMGYMTNPNEDMLMQTAEYQEKIVQGIADGVDAFFGYE